MSKHLEIKQNSLQENVSAEVIDRLYNLTYEDSTLGIDPVVDSQRGDIVGNIISPAAYEDAVSFLRDKFGPDVANNIEGLTITVTDNNYYVRFKDPIFGQACIKKYSNNGVGVTKTRLAAVTDPGNLITSNNVWDSSLGDKTQVTSLEDFKYFTGILNRNSNVINGFTNATKIVFPSTTFSYDNQYTLNLVTNCQNIEEVDYQNAIFIGPLNNGELYVINKNDRISEWNDSLIPKQTNFHRIRLFNSWKALKKIIFPEGVTSTYDNAYGCNSLQYIEFPTTITDIGKACDFGRDSGHRIPAMVIKAVTPPDWYGYNPNNTSQSGRGFGYDMMPLNIYVPDNSVTAYKSFVNGGTNNEQAWASDYIKGLIKPLSELPQTYREMGTVTQDDIDRV